MNPSQQSKPTPKRAGFTLIELSVVLVIIGLIAGGILVGNSMIEQSQLRGVMNQIDEYKVAYHNFKLKYNCIPGDCARALQFGFTAGAYHWTYGDGDGFISSDNDGALIPGTDFPTYSETWNASSQLYQARMVQLNMKHISKGPTNNTMLKTGNGVIFFTSFRPFFTPDKATNYLYLGSHPTNEQHFSVTAPVFTPAQAFSLDLKLDDGDPMQGIVRASYTMHRCRGNNDPDVGTTSIITPGPCFNRPYPRSDHGGCLTCTCVNDLVTPFIYDLTRTAKNCSIHLPVN